jgi:1-acyl-sn-glycerol-3-phosphate acyltransferase
MSQPEAGVPARFTAKSHAAVRYVAQRGLLKPAVWTFTKVTVLGRHRLTELNAPFIVVANHLSHLDAPLIMSALPARMARRLAAAAASDYFFDVPWRRGLTSLFFNAFPVRRDSSDPRRTEPAQEPPRPERDAGYSARTLLEMGVPILVFPEGGRQKTGRTGQFKTGAARLALELGVPCVPAAIVGTYDAQPPGTSWWPKSGRPPIGVSFGAPLRPTADDNAETFSERLRAEIVELMNTSTPAIMGRHADADGSVPS